MKWGSHFQNQYHLKWTMLQQKCFATIQLQIPDCAILTKDNIGFKLCEITISLYLSMLIPSLTWQICLPSLYLEKHLQICEARYSGSSHNIVDNCSQQCHVWGGEFEIRIGHWPVMSDPSLDRRLLDMYIISCYYCRRSRVGVTGIQYFRLVMMLLDSRCRCTLFSVSDLNIRKTKFGEYLECSRSLFGVSRSQFGVFSSRNIWRCKLNWRFTFN